MKFLLIFLFAFSALGFPGSGAGDPPDDPPANSEIWNSSEPGQGDPPPDLEGERRRVLNLLRA